MRLAFNLLLFCVVLFIVGRFAWSRLPTTEETWARIAAESEQRKQREEEAEALERAPRVPGNHTARTPVGQDPATSTSGLPRIHGFIYYPDGKPFEDAGVRFIRSELVQADSSAEPEPQWVYAGPNGYFTFSIPSDWGSASLQVQELDFARFSMQGVGAAQEPLLIQLEPQGFIEGFIHVDERWMASKNSALGRTVPTASSAIALQAKGQESGRLHRAQVTRDLHFSFGEHLPNEQHDLILYIENLESLRIPNVAPSTQEQPQDPRITPIDLRGHLTELVLRVEFPHDDQAETLKVNAHGSWVVRVSPRTQELRAIVPRNAPRELWITCRGYVETPVQVPPYEQVVSMVPAVEVRLRPETPLVIPKGYGIELTVRKPTSDRRMTGDSTTWDPVLECWRVYISDWGTYTTFLIPTTPPAPSGPKSRGAQRGGVLLPLGTVHLEEGIDPPPIHLDMIKLQEAWSK